MAFRLPRPRDSDQVVTNEGRWSILGLRWWNSTMERIERQEARQDATIADLAAANDAIVTNEEAVVAAQESADSAAGTLLLAQEALGLLTARVVVLEAGAVTTRTTLDDHETRITALEP